MRSFKGRVWWWWWKQRRRGGWMGSQQLPHTHTYTQEPHTHTQGSHTPTPRNHILTQNLRIDLRVVYTTSHHVTITLFHTTLHYNHNNYTTLCTSPYHIMPNLNYTIPHHTINQCHPGGHFATHHTIPHHTSLTSTTIVNTTSKGYDQTVRFVIFTQL